MSREHLMVLHFRRQSALLDRYAVAARFGLGGDATDVLHVDVLILIVARDNQL